MKILVLGEGRHGKDFFTEILSDETGLRFQSSSQACADIFIYDALKDKYGYQTPEQCFEDRHNHRIEWRDMIRDYNSRDRARLAKEVLKTNDIYVGMRCHMEYAASKNLFNLIIWIDASERIKEKDDSLTIEYNSNEMLRVTNNRDLKDFVNKTKFLAAGVKIVSTFEEIQNEIEQELHTR